MCKLRMTTLQLVLTAVVGLEGLATALVGLYAKRASERAAAAADLAEEARAVQVGRRRADPRQ